MTDGESSVPPRTTAIARPVLARKPMATTLDVLMNYPQITQITQIGRATKKAQNELSNSCRGVDSSIRGFLLSLLCIFVASSFFNLRNLCNLWMILSSRMRHLFRLDPLIELLAG